MNDDEYEVKLIKANVNHSPSDYEFPIPAQIYEDDIKPNSKSKRVSSAVKSADCKQSKTIPRRHRQTKC